jgi:putative transposase
VAAVDHDGGSLLHRSSRGSAGPMDFTAVLKKAEIAISMDGKGAWRDNLFVERLWRSIKYEEVVCCERLVLA